MLTNLENLYIFTEETQDRYFKKYGRFYRVTNVRIDNYGDIFYLTESVLSEGEKMVRMFSERAIHKMENMFYVQKNACEIISVSWTGDKLIDNYIRTWGTANGNYFRVVFKNDLGWWVVSVCEKIDEKDIFKAKSIFFIEKSRKCYINNNLHMNSISNIFGKEY